MKYLILSIGLIGGISYLCSSDSKTYTIHITEDSLAEIDTFFTTPFEHTTSFSNKVQVCSDDTIIFSYSINSTTDFHKRNLSFFDTDYIKYNSIKKCDWTPQKWGWTDWRDDFPFVLKGTGMTLYYNKLKAKKVDITVTTTFWGY